MTLYRNYYIKKTWEKVSIFRYHKGQKHAAEQILKSLESIKGKINPSLIKLSDEYARDVFGWSGYAPWLYVYSAVADKFKEGWIPDNYFAKVVLPSIDGGYGKVSDFKPLSRRLFDSKLFPDLAYYVNGLFLSDDYRILPVKDLTEILFKNRSVIVFKLDNSMQGKGVFVFEKHAFEISKVIKLGNGVFQYFIEQHPFFDEFMPASVATIRITTYVEETGNISVRGCFLRLGRAREKSIKWNSNILVPIDSQTGELNQQGYFLNMLSIDRHPDTQILFANKIIPYFDKCISTARNLHKQMPFDRCVGWDMVVDRENNVKVMEWNGDHTDIKVHEAIQGPCFSGLGWEKLWRKANL